MQTLVIPQSGAPNSDPGGCSCGLRAPLTDPNPESSACDSERPNPGNSTQPNDNPGLFTSLRKLFDQARIVVPNSQGQPYGGMENRPHGIMQPDQFTYGYGQHPHQPGGNNRATNTTPRRWQTYRQPQARQTPPKTIRPFRRQPSANPQRPIMHRNPRHFACNTGQSQSAPISVNGALNASGGDTSLLYLNLYSTGKLSPNDYPYAGQVGQ